jgi:hypothetical protein
MPHPLFSRMRSVGWEGSAANPLGIVGHKMTPTSMGRIYRVDQVHMNIEFHKRPIGF